MPVAALLVAIAALVVATVSLIVGSRAVRALDAIAGRLAPPPAPEAAAAPPAGAARSGLAAELRPAAGGGLALVLRNGGPRPAGELVVAIDGCFAGAAHGAYEDARPPRLLDAGEEWRCDLADPPAAGRTLHLLVRWSAGDETRRAEWELAAPA